MKHSFLFITFWVIFSTISFSQKIDKNYGKVTINDFNVEVPENDDAVVIFDKGEVKFTEGRDRFHIIFERTRRIKIATDRGVSYANDEILLYKSKERREQVYQFSAATYNFNKTTGLIEKEEIDKKDLMSEEVNKYWQREKFTYPKAKKGSIIEYKYKVESPFIFTLPKWNFQAKIPTLYSKFTVNIIPLYNYVFTTQSIKKFFSTSNKRLNGVFNFKGKDYDIIRYDFVMKNTPAFKDEEYISSIDDYLMQVKFQISEYQNLQGGTVEVLSTYPKFIDELSKDHRFGKYLKKSTSFAKKVFEVHPELNKGPEAEKAEKIIRYVKDGYNWNNFYSNLATETPKKIFDTKEGNVAELNFFTAGLLQAAGIKVYPVILSSRGHGKINKKYPFQEVFNYTIFLIELDGKEHLYDVTTPMLGTYILPPRCNNGDGLLINGDESKWIKIANHLTSLDQTTINISDIDLEKHTASVSYVNNTSSIEAYINKLRFNDKEEKIKKYLLDNGFTSIDQQRTKGYKDFDKLYRIAAAGKSEVEQLQDHIVVQPFLKLFEEKQPFTSHIRTYPIDFTNAFTKGAKSTIVIPNGYEFIEGPQNYSFKDPTMSLKVSTKVNGNNVEIDFKLSFKKAVYDAEDYFMIKKIYDKYLKAVETPVVLKKKVEQ
ncbi:DUF3857 domain-containing protein [Flammeovirga sp. MY04]|uniref:DUF3857 domain-containing protein n=1 Tax=Flammeovirga sp. MY04 TaxID=1191459 RepID=UPI00080627FA|nr:DUF3857 domain-containing protein [Flammeovirga sp. MY04]ANQ47805.1 DUF3857 domain-containing protein [Flammeovirga sp. MY04]